MFLENTVRSGPMRILVADDSALLRHLVKRYLQGLGFQARYVADGEHAIGEIYAEPLDLFIVGLKLPFGEGFQVIQAARCQHPRARIIAISSLSEEWARQTAFQQGADHFLLKPFTQAEFREVLGRAVSETSGYIASPTLARVRHL